MHRKGQLVRKIFITMLPTLSRGGVGSKREMGMLLGFASKRDAMEDMLPSMSPWRLRFQARRQTPNHLQRKI